MSWSPQDALDDYGRTPAEARRAGQCQCAGQMPGSCPGPAFCPMCDYAEADAAADYSFRERCEAWDGMP